MSWFYSAVTPLESGGRRRLIHILLRNIGDEAVNKVVVTALIDNSGRHSGSDAKRLSGRPFTVKPGCEEALLLAYRDEKDGEFITEGEQIVLANQSGAGIHDAWGEMGVKLLAYAGGTLACEARLRLYVSAMGQLTVEEA